MFLVLLAVILISAGVCSVDEPREDRQLAVFVYTSTQTFLSVTTTTSRVPRICIFGPYTLTTCTGRRRRKRREHRADARPARLPQPSGAAELHSSLRQQMGVPADRRARLIAFRLTSLVSLTTTSTSTVSSTDTATTLSVSILCTAAGMNLETIYCGSG